MRRVLLVVGLVLVLVATSMPEAQAASRYNYIVREQPFGRPPMMKNNPFVATAGYGYGAFRFRQVGETFTLFIDDRGTPNGASIAVFMRSARSKSDWYGCVPVRRTVVLRRYRAGDWVTVGLEPATHPEHSGQYLPLPDCSGHGTVGSVDYQP